MSVYTLEGRLAKIEKERGATDAEDPFNEILRRVDEPPCANAARRSDAVLKLMQTLDWNDRPRRPGFLDGPPNHSAGRS